MSILATERRSRVFTDSRKRGDKTMFLAGLIYLIVIILMALGLGFWNETRSRWVGSAAFILFVIIGIVLFWSVLNKG